MGETTGIAWTKHTFNPWWGCEKVSAGCRNCYAEGFAVKRMGLPIWGGDGTERRFFGDAHWKDPVRWNRAAEKAAERARVFCASMADVFEDRIDLIAPRGRLFDLVLATPWLTWQLLTKRPENITRMVPPSWLDRWPAHVWIGCTVEDQEHVYKRIPHLFRVPAAVRFLSVEPQVEAIDLALPWLFENESYPASPDIHWVIQGGESGSKARPFDLAWARSLRDQCKAAGVPYFLKQLGARPCEETAGENHRRVNVEVGHSHGADESEWPADLRGCRAFPEARS